MKIDNIVKNPYATVYEVSKEGVKFEVIVRDDSTKTVFLFGGESVKAPFPLDDFVFIVSEKRKPALTLIRKYMDFSGYLHDQPVSCLEPR